ncbi:MAG: DUF1615 domain-containing protein [Rhodocyclales bacterium]|nr:DUF1615 domain-containing protein [Rhodocyclales bacterium]
MRSRWIHVPLLVATLLAGCSSAPIFAPATTAASRSAGEPPGPPLPRDLARRADGRIASGWPISVHEHDGKARIARLINPTVRDRAGWAEDLYAAFTHLKIVHANETYCAAIAIIEQESAFQADPPVPGLPDIVRRELDRRAERYGVPKMLIAAALKTNSATGRTYEQRIDALRTEKQLSDLFDDMIDDLPLGRQLLADYNPVHTGGPMQVGVSFAEQQVQERRYPYPMPRALRDELFTRRGGVYFGTAMLLDYPAPYDDILYRLADYNAGRYSSRNAAFQAALARWTGHALVPDGDLLRYQNGRPSEVPSQVELALRAQAAALQMSVPQIRRELLLEKSAAFGDSPLYARVFAFADKAAGSALPRQMLPRIDLNSPKFERRLTTEGFAHRVAQRQRACLTRGAL